MHRHARSRVLVFTAGLLLRLLKTGVYRLGQASLLVMMDAFTGAAAQQGVVGPTGCCQHQLLLGRSGC